MFTLKKIISSFLLPPGIFILLFIAAGAYLLRLKKRRSGIITLTAAFAFWLACTAPFSSFLMEFLESEYPIPETVKGDVIVLLGGGVIDGVPDLSGKGVPSGQMFPRLVTAVRLQRRLAVPIIVSGGKVDEASTAEAVIVKRFLIDLGVDEGRIIVEDKSRDTHENAAFTKVICRERSFANPILLTSAYHMKRSVESFKKAGLSVVPFPTNFYALGHPEYSFQNYLPLVHSLAVTSYAAHEYVGRLFYRMVH